MAETIRLRGQAGPENAGRVAIVAFGRAFEAATGRAATISTIGALLLSDPAASGLTDQPQSLIRGTHSVSRGPEAGR